MRMNTLDRRGFLTVTGLAGAGLAGAGLSGISLGASRAGAAPLTASPGDGDAHRGPCAIASGNCDPGVAKAYEMVMNGFDPADAVVAAVKFNEDDPNDQSVGLGGLPNEEGIVELDASVMHGPTHKAGSVSSLRNIKNPAAVALEVLRKTDHVMIVGEGALKFALRMGFKEENLLTEQSRRAWVQWRANLNKDDKWLDDDQQIQPVGGKKVSAIEKSLMFTWGTVHCSALTPAGDMAACTSTSGLSWKLPGRIGDSPIIGAGMYCDNNVGCAGATGRGESMIVNCGSYAIVQNMERGLSPSEACAAFLNKLCDHTKEKHLLDAKGRPNFNVSVYALRKDGAYAGACIHPGGSFVVADGTAANGKNLRSLACTPLFND